MTIGVVSGPLESSWGEADHAVRSFAGALACTDEVVLLQPVASGVRRRPTMGPFEIRSFPVESATPPLDPVAARRAVFGPQPGMSCQCIDRKLRTLAASVPDAIGRELLRAGHGSAPSLTDHLRRSSYDLLVFAGATRWSTIEGLAAAPAATPTILLPTLVDDPCNGLPAVRHAVDRADLIVVHSTWERALLSRLFAVPADRIVELTAVLRVHSLARRDRPHHLDAAPTVVIAGDWKSEDPEQAISIAAAVERRTSLQARIVGPGWDDVPHRFSGRFTGNRMDVWRWMARAFAVIEVRPERLIAREVVESLLLGTPAVVSTAAGAGQEVVRKADGGLWFRDHSDLISCLEALSEPEVRGALVRQGHAWATLHYTDTRAYISSVAAAVSPLRAS